MTCFPSTLSLMRACYFNLIKHAPSRGLEVLDLSVDSSSDSVCYIIFFIFLPYGHSHIFFVYVLLRCTGFGTVLGSELDWYCQDHLPSLDFFLVVLLSITAVSS